MEFTMNLQYAAGHTGTFEMSFSCTDTSENGLSAVRCLPAMVSAASPAGMPPRVQSAPALIGPSDDIESIFSTLSYRDFLHHEPAIAEEGEPTAAAAGACRNLSRILRHATPGSC